PAGPEARRLLRRDLRAPGADGHAWDLEVRSASPGEPVTIQTIMQTALPDHLALRLVDRELDAAVDLRWPGGAPGSYPLASFGPDRAYRLTLFAGTPEYLARVVGDERATPDRLLLEHGAPNPFRSLP